MAEEKGKTLVDDRWKEGLEDTQAAVRQYWTNFSFWGGAQWVYWSEAEKGIRRVAPNAKRSRVTRNRIRRSVRVNLAKLLKNPLAFDVSPNAADDAAVKGAQLASTALDDAKTRGNWENIRSDEVFQTSIGGTAAVCVDWDPAGYKQHTVSEKGRPAGEGDACLTALSVREFVVQPGVKDGEFARWWIKQTAEDPKDVQARYGLDKEPSPDATSALSGFQQRVLDSGQGTASRSVKGRVLVRTMYERPSKAMPRGRVQTVVDGKVVEDVAWPFPVKDRLNLFVFRDMKADGWLGESVITDAIPVQTELNLSRSIIMEHLKKAGNARLWVPDASIDDDDLTDDPGQPVFYNPVGGAHPEWSSPPNLPQWEIDYPEQAGAEIDDILGVHDVSRGDVPTGIESGAALSIIAERDDTPLGIFARDQAETWGRIGSFVLKLYEAKVTMPREITVSPKNDDGGPTRRPYTENFSGDMLHGQTHATVPLEVMQPKSRAVAQAQADNLLQMGALGTPPDMRLYVRIADLPDKGLLLAALSADAAKAQRVCEQMFRGETVVPRKFDNFGIHIAEVNAQRKTERYERADSTIQHRFDLYVQACETLAAEQVGGQEMKAAESPNLAAAPQGDEPIGSAVPAASGDQLAAQGQVPPELVPPPGPEELAAMAPPPPPEPQTQGSAT